MSCVVAAFVAVPMFEEAMMLLMGSGSLSIATTRGGEGKGLYAGETN